MFRKLLYSAVFAFICVLFVYVFYSQSLAITPNLEKKHGYKFQDCSECPKMIIVRGDTFLMGASKFEIEHYKDEKPQHTVRIKKFAVGQFEVTWKQYNKFVEQTEYNPKNRCKTFENSEWGWRENRNYRKPGYLIRDNLPVTCVSWHDAKAYVIWLSGKTGKKYRLLTEAEWEYVASAKKTTPFWWGRYISEDQANYGGSAYSGSKLKNSLMQVNSFYPNPFGLYNVHGNVYEWVEDCYHETYDSAPADGSPWLKKNDGKCQVRVLRGGSWLNEAKYLRAHFRYKESKTHSTIYIGFRVARTL